MQSKHGPSLRFCLVETFPITLTLLVAVPTLTSVGAGVLPALGNMGSNSLGLLWAFTGKQYR